MDDFSSSTDEEQKELKAQQDDINRPRATRLQWGGFSKKTIVEQVCPFASCGRKFVSADQLRIHIDRRHKPQTHAETKETPIPATSKV
jgi:hypothetical protein